MQCNKSGCKQQFHVTCAQQKGLLCEEAGNYLDNVKYCGYCSYHYGKLKKGGNVKPIPPYRPQIRDHSSGSDSCSSPEKELEPPTSTALPLALPTSATSIKITTNSTSSATPSNSSSSATKQRKTSSTTKPQLFPTSSAAVPAASVSGMNLSMSANPSLSGTAGIGPGTGSLAGSGGNGGSGGGVGSVGSSNLTGAGTNLITTNPISSKNSSNSSSSASSSSSTISSKDKDKHSKNLSKNSSSSTKDKDKDKDSSSSSSSSSSKGGSGSSKSKSKELFVENGIEKTTNNSPAVTSAIGES